MAQLTPRLLCLNEAGYPSARKIATALGLRVEGRAGRVAEADVSFENALDHVRDLFAVGHPIIGVCASGILIRAVAPLLVDKSTEPPVISVAESGTVVPLLGGHHGANRLSKEIAAILDGTAAVTTGGDVSLGIALDEPPEGWALANPENAKDVMSCLLNGGGALVSGEVPFLTELPEGDDVKITATSTPIAPAPNELVYHPKIYALGLGCSRNCPPEELCGLIAQTLEEADIAPGAIAGVFSIDVKADEPAVLQCAQEIDRPLRFFPADMLETVADRLANPSDVVFAEVGTHGVSEAAALLGAGPDAKLIVPKQKTANATCAIAKAPQPITQIVGTRRGKVSLVGIGPGQSAWRTPEASKLVAEADELVGYGLYIDLLGPLAAGKPRKDFPLGGEEARCRYALEEAAKGQNIALICSGDAGIYAMGALVFELLDRGPDGSGVSAEALRVEVVSAPGVSALQAAAARAGAPLGHDFCAISLSDLLTPREDILKRLKAAAEGDFVIAFYNPVSKKRRTLLAEARDILLRHRPKDTPVLLATSLGRPEETLRYRALAELEVDEVDMLTVVLVGSSRSRLLDLAGEPRLYTPRGYERRIDGDLSERAAS